MVFIAAAALLATLGLKQANATPAPPRHPYHKACDSFTIPIPVTVHQQLYDLPRVDSNIDASAYSVDDDTWSNPSYVHRIAENITISKTWDIYATLCVPHGGSKKDILHIATHGGGFDGRYWDSAVEPDKYSYVKAALEAGYSILTYDRVATGRSSKPDAYREVQIPAAVEVLAGLTRAVRKGKLAKYVSGKSSFDKIVHVGHSLGSVTTYGLTAIHPHLSDAAIVTGFIINKYVMDKRQSIDNLHFAPDDGFPHARSGYTVQGSPEALQVGFFSTRKNATTGVGGFDPKMLHYAFETRQPSGLAEHGSAGVLYAQHPIAPAYQGPVLLLNGEFDYVVCLGDCKKTYDAKMVEGMFPRSKGVEIEIQQRSGHGLPFHRAAQEGFRAKFEFLERYGL